MTDILEIKKRQTAWTLFRILKPQLVRKDLEMRTAHKGLPNPEPNPWYYGVT